MVVTTRGLRVVLLSRGWSRRYPGDKALAPTPGGLPLLLHVVSTVRLALGSPRIIVYTSLEDKCGEYKRIANVECRLDPLEAREKGPGALIKASLKEHGAPLLTLPVDLPLLGMEALRLLLDAGGDLSRGCARTLVTAGDVQALVQYHPQSPHGRTLSLLESLPRPARATDMLRSSHCLELVTLPPRLWSQLCHLQTPEGYKCPGGGVWRPPSRILPTLATLVEGATGGLEGVLELEARMWRGLGFRLLESHSREDAWLVKRGREDAGHGRF